MARRIAKSAIDWGKFLEYIPKDELANFQTFKAKSETYLRNMYALPENLPQIDFSVYRKRLPNTALVDEFEQKYKALKIPYPTDAESIQQIEAETKRANEQAKQDIAESKLRIQSHQERIAVMKKMIPLEHMTMEDYWLAYPERGFRPDKPTFWPHTEKFQEEVAEGLEELKAKLTKKH
ncbi:ATP synthase subunit d, mitochondrial-like [Varroa jacobsoni]|uniref:ATP synthase subunit d, mitochondrial-like n=1 Tax=Varroa jacobsoni TaxID=62625 RepID=UPI000BF40F91|nr:ATP synthase subunit d, mitochondrial-like [Varroa jacobsoni]XP_022691672.1 ATP synthase subunit d, mitochondrial-like [Varroa jacobsoni]